jgi:putative oxidoreductase
MNFVDRLASHAHWPIRLSLAATFIVHGIPKIPPDTFVQMSGMPEIIGWLVGLGETGAGLALIVGAFTDERLTRLGGLIVIIIMIGAIVLVHARNGWNVSNGGMEFQVLMLAAGVYFLTKGNNA